MALANKLHTFCSTALDTNTEWKLAGHARLPQEPIVHTARMASIALANKMHTFCSTALDTNAERELPGAARWSQEPTVYTATVDPTALAKQVAHLLQHRS